MNCTYALFKHTMSDKFIGSYQTYGIMCLQYPQFVVNDVSIDCDEAYCILLQLNINPPPPEKLLEAIIDML